MPQNMNADSNQITRDYIDSILVETRYIDADLPSTEITLFGKNFKTPVTTAALSHLYTICDNAMAEFAKGARDAGAVNFIGMGSREELEEVTAQGADTIKIIKPYEDNDEILSRIEHAVKCGVFALGMDIDHAFASNGTYDSIYGLHMKSKSFDEICSFVKASPVPFIIKGVMGASDAEKALKAGAGGIVVSHHHGIMDYSIPPLMALPDIVKVIDGEIPIFIDCGIESGMDVFKALALGASAVSVGRVLMEPLKARAPGVSKKLNEITMSLCSIMARTGAHSIKDIDPSVLRFRNF